MEVSILHCFEHSMVVTVTGESTSLLLVSLTGIQPMLVVIRVMLFTLYCNTVTTLGVEQR